MTRRSRLGLMEIEDAVHCFYMGKGLTRCPTCGEDLTFEGKKSETKETAWQKRWSTFKDIYKKL